MIGSNSIQESHAFQCRIQAFGPLHFDPDEINL